MKNIMRALVLATLTVAFALSLTTGAEARRYIKDKNQTGARVPDHLGDGRGDDVVVVPEPGTLALLGLGVASVAAARRRRQKNDKAAA
jgi:hypothetical protein